jgi:heme-degrading monooxygenase HmoA
VDFDTGVPQFARFEEGKDMRLGVASVVIIGAWLAQMATAPASEQRSVIVRQWHGKTTAADADRYEHYLAESIKKFTTIPGNRGYQLLREDAGNLTHFSVLSFWDSRESIHGYAGADISKVRPLPRDPEFLVDPETNVRNYDLRVDARR